MSGIPLRSSQADRVVCFADVSSVTVTSEEQLILLSLSFAMRIVAATRMRLEKLEY